MFKHLVLYQLKTINHLINHRNGEVKFGEKLQFLNADDSIEEQLKSSDAKYVVFGIPEDIGVLLNQGKPGTKNAWEATLQALLNIQQNQFNKGKRVLLLGHLDFSGQIDQLKNLDTDSLRTAGQKIIDLIDKEVTYLVQQIVSAGKKPVIIGGGHNNAYGIIKGCSLALNKPINVINIDAHTDFRMRDIRHSGNGFSFAYFEGFLKRYYIFGLHENYTSKKIFNTLFEEKENIGFSTFEELEIRKEKGIDIEINEALEFVKNGRFGVEIDCDAIENIPSSAMTPSGFNINTVRQLVNKLRKNKNVQYLHICEAAPNVDNRQEMQQAGKLITYLITDFIRK